MRLYVPGKVNEKDVKQAKVYAPERDLHMSEQIQFQDNFTDSIEGQQIHSDDLLEGLEGRTD